MKRSLQTRPQNKTKMENLTRDFSKIPSIRNGVGGHTSMDVPANDDDCDHSYCADSDSYGDLVLDDYDHEHQSISSIHAEEEGDDNESFAAHFYRYGTDWSCLVSDQQTVSADSNKRKLKQANLLEVWGFKKPLPLPSQPTTTKRIKTISPPHNASLVTKRPRLCPFFKRIPGTGFTVDAFRYGAVKECSAYFLTHFHADHYGGLTKRWSHGPVYCSPLTARLLKVCLSLDSAFIRPLEMNEEYVIQGVRVTLLEANHCPGAALVHFRLSDGQCVLHTGDFRASKLMQTYPLLVKNPVNLLYLDTTYCNPKYKFPSKGDVLSYVVTVTKNFLQKQPQTLVIVGAYSIGKECVYLAISKALGVKIYVNASKRRILQSFGWTELSASLCTQAKDTLLHVLPISSLRYETLEDYLKSYRNQYTKILAFRPTGWTYSDKVGQHLDQIRPSSKGNITIYGVPYSEHSSFTELEEFVKFLRPDKIIPTVNNWNPANREKMQSYFRVWLQG